MPANRCGRCGTQATVPRHASGSSSARSTPPTRTVPGVGRTKPSSTREQRRLAAAARPGERHDLARRRRSATRRRAPARRGRGTRRPAPRCAVALRRVRDVGPRAARRRHGASSTSKTCSAAARPSALAWKLAPSAPQRQVGLGREHEHEQRRSAGRDAPSSSRSPTATATSATDSVATSSSTSEDRNASRSVRHACVAGSASVTCADRRRLGLGPPEDLQRRQPGDDVEEVAGQPLQRAQLASRGARAWPAPTSAMKIGISGSVTAMISGRDPVLRDDATSTATGHDHGQHAAAAGSGEK